MEKKILTKRKSKKIPQKILIGFGIAAGTLIVGFLILLVTLTVTEYKPDDIEDLSVNGYASKEIAKGDTFTIMTWNIGYGALGSSADFFMDGGTQVNPSTTEQVNNNVSAIKDNIDSINPDVVFLQEVDRDSKRSHYINEENIISSLNGYQSSFATNYKTLYVPYPLPTIGKVNCGIMTLSNYKVDSSTRQALPCPFSYPMRLCNLKRCLMINRVSIEGSDKELVLVNLHLEAYDDGEGKAAQTEMLKNILQNEFDKGNYVIAGGDFNQTFSNTDLSSYPLIDDKLWAAGKIDINDFSNDWQFIMDSSTPTCRSLDKIYEGNDKSDFQYYMIDGFIVSSNIIVNSVETKNLQFENTDHNPVVMSVTIK